jgi:hypothetical protein
MIIVLRGFVECRNTDNVKCTIVHRIYRNGNIVDSVDSDTLEDNTILIKAVAINRNIVQFTAHKVLSDGGTIILEEIDLYDEKITDDLLNAIEKVTAICYSDNSDKNGFFRDDKCSLFRDVAIT